jgi:hypothetical protein
MLKNTLYGAVAGGLLAAAAVSTQAIAAPAAPVTPQVKKGVEKVHDTRWRRHYRHRHHHHGYYYYGPTYYYGPGPGVGLYLRAW